MKLLITGAGGFLGAGLITALERKHKLRLLDVAKFNSPHEIVVGDVSDWETCRHAADGMEGIVIAHMAPHRPEVYDMPPVPFDVNVKGTANLFAAAVEKGIHRVVLISSSGVVGSLYQAGGFLHADMPLLPTNLYSLTKVAQEIIADYYHRNHGVAVAVFRPGYITDADAGRDKYGRQFSTINWQFIDRQDIGDAADCALRLPDLKCETFYILGHPDASKHADMERTQRRLSWKPAHDFSQYPDDQPITKD